MTDVLKLYSKGSGHYESEDGRVVVTLDDTFETFCEGPHPVRYRLDRLSEVEKRELPLDAKRTTRRTKGGWVEYVSYECLGDASHYYSMWTVSVDGEWTENVYETLGEALSVVEDATGTKVKRVRRKVKRERVREFDAVTGAATWKRCGHRAELDVNEDCYTCHESPLMEVAA